MVVREARVKGTPKWSTYHGASIAGAAEAVVASSLDSIVRAMKSVRVEVRDVDTPDTIWELIVSRTEGWEVRGLRGGE